MKRLFVRVLLTFSCICLFPLSVGATAKAEQQPDLSLKEREWLALHPDIRLAFDGDFPPYSFLNDNGEIEGFSVDVFRLIEKRLGISFELYPENAWKPLYTAAKDKKADVVATMVERGDRQEWFNFTSPYVFKSLVVIARADDDRFHHRNDIAGKRLALVKSYQYVGKILEDFPSVIPHYVDNMLDALNAVSVGDADAAITFLGAGHYYRNKYLLSNLKYAAIYDKRNSNEHIAVRKDWPELASILDKALASISEQEMQELRDHWLPAEYSENLLEINLTAKEREWIRQHPDIRLGVDPEFAPFEYLDQGRYQGMASDYVKVLNQRLQLNMTVVPGLDWNGVMEGAIQGEIDVLPAVGRTAEREAFLSYTKPYLSFHRVIVTRAEAPFISSLNDLSRQQIAVQANTSHHGYLKENTDIRPVLYESLQDSLLAVSGNEVDAFIGNVASITYWIRKLNLTNLKIAAPVSREVQSLHFAVRDDWPELVDILQKGLDSISDRQRKAISEKWLSVEYEAQVDYRLIWQVAGGFTLLLMLAMLWNFSLNRKVQQRTSELTYSASYDQLTDLPNRLTIMDRLQQAINDARRRQEKVALLSIDLDDFKSINDAFGHRTGDAVLMELVTRLRTSIGSSDVAGRLGGDQFLVVLQHLSYLSDAVRVAEQILTRLNSEFYTSRREVSLSASIGISVFPEDGEDPETLLKHADAATHFCKEKARGGFSFYSGDLAQQAERRLEVEQHMRGALERNEFQVFFQTKVDAKSRQVVSFEALLRWFNDELGPVSPVEFIPVAEKNGLIEPIGMFVLETALKYLAQWQKRFDPKLTMAVNLSPVQFRSREFIPQVLAVINEAGVAYQALEFEITEGVLMSDSPDIERKLTQLEAMGVTLSMDDFGTGYSSMNYLRKFNFDQLKIDREFIADLTEDESDRKLVAATIAMAHELGMTVVAEGVETEEQSSILASQHCDILQGWLFSKPEAPEKVSAYLEQLYQQRSQL